ncbi:hypothetical protein BJX70DRAFT_403076 [Aspergillus crustosus]
MSQIPDTESKSYVLDEKTTGDNVSKATSDTPTETLRETCDIAIIGGGIIGAIVALGLIHRGLKVTVYERASKFTETSAGFSFNAVARQAMQYINPRVLDALLRVATPNEHPYIRYCDGVTPGVEKALWQIPAERPDYRGCLRAAFLDSLGREIPEELVQFGKDLDTYEDATDSGKVVLRFTDGTVAEVDAVIGCDGIKSRTRQIMLGESHPAASPGFTHIVAYRAVVPIEGVVAALGQDKGLSHCLHVGPGAFTVTYPIANNTLTNLILFCQHPTSWPSATKLLETCTRTTAQSAIRDWTPDIRATIDLLPEKPTKWAIFDTSDNPAPTYTSGRVCIAGDAAHASTPFLASGAAMGVEDAAVLATTLDIALSRASASAVSGREKTNAISAAFQAYSNIRMERSQRTVQHSRDAGHICMHQNEETALDPEKCYQAIWERYTKIWEFDVADMTEKAREECLRLLE